LRSKFAALCPKSSAPTACNALAYIEEIGLKGKPNMAAALKHHLRACALGSASSCIRLLTRRSGRPRAPRGIDPEVLEERISFRCENARDEAACLALATAFEIGWGVPRGRDRARDILEHA